MVQIAREAAAEAGAVPALTMLTPVAKPSATAAKPEISSVL